MGNEHVKERLLLVYPSTQQGSWDIYGEDPNCDLGGSHHEPYLETVYGTYSNVVEYAMNLPNFFTWGGGGRIKKSNSATRNVDNLFSKENVALRKEREQLVKEIATKTHRLQDIDEKLKGI